MSRTAAKPESVADATPRGASADPSAAKARKLALWIVTSDDALWSQVGAPGADWIPKQVDSIDELVAITQRGQPGAILWDARGCPAVAEALSRVTQHSERFAVISLDATGSVAPWSRLIEQRQLVAHIDFSNIAEALPEALATAREEVESRLALLGNGSTGATATPRRTPPRVWVWGSIAAAAIAAVGAALMLRHPESPVVESATRQATAPQQPDAATDEKVDALVGRAHQAMLDKHYLDPVEGSALELYRGVLVLDASNGEAAEGLRRLADVLVARVQSALDEHKFDVALQSLETARSISPTDRRLAVLDERIASMRAELGPAQILAAMNALNFDRATELIDEAAQTKVLSVAKANQLRDEVRRRRDQVGIEHFLTLLDARLQQERLIDPHGDSAADYLAQARQAGAAPAALQSRLDEFIKRCVTAVKGAIDQHRLNDAERLIAELRNANAPAPTVTALQRDLTAAHGSAAPDKPGSAQLLEAARARLALGNVIEPENDSALHYVNQLRAVDPQNSALAPLAGAVQTQLLQRATAALAAADTAKAENFLRQAAGLGTSTEMDALNERVLQAKLAAAAATGAPGAMDAAASGIRNVPENSLTRVRELQLEYPRDALNSGTEGWVEISFTVTAKGTVTDPTISNANPSGVFEAAATDAVMHLRYKPFVQDGKPTAVRSAVRVAFRLKQRTGSR